MAVETKSYVANTGAPALPRQFSPRRRTPGAGVERTGYPLLATPTTRDRHRGAGRLVAGFRGRPAADAPALVDLLGRLSRLGEDLPELAELDLNPVLALSEGYVAVDARIRVRRPSPVSTPKTW